MNKKPTRKRTRGVEVRGVAIGNAAPIAIQSMLNVPTTDIDSALDQIRRLSSAGCDIIRLAIRDDKALSAFRTIREAVDIPLVADIHFDYKLAVGAAEAGADKLRINPGNIGSVDRVKEVAMIAIDKGIPIRIGVNAGSLPDGLPDNVPLPERMVIAAENEIKALEDVGFEDIVVSLKSHNALDVIEANRLFSEEFDYPLHLGVTEAGLPPDALIKSSVGIGTLLVEGIGDTIRFSITGDPILEVTAARTLLRACNLIDSGIELVSCPVCGRCRVNLEEIANRVRESLPETDKHLVVAIMGCEVNGPGEAKNADIGIAGGKESFLLFKSGEPVEKIPQDEAVEILIAEIEKLIHRE